MNKLKKIEQGLMIKGGNNGLPTVPPISNPSAETLRPDSGSEMTFEEWRIERKKLIGALKDIASRKNCSHLDKGLCRCTIHVARTILAEIIKLKEIL